MAARKSAKTKRARKKSAKKRPAKKKATRKPAKKRPAKKKPARKKAASKPRPGGRKIGRAEMLALGRKQATAANQAAITAMMASASGEFEDSGVGIPEALDYCPGCEKNRPMSDWTLRKGESQTAIGAFLCHECRASGTLPTTDLLPTLPLRDRNILRDLVVCQNVAEVARRNHTTVAYVNKALEGRGDDVPLIRKAWQQMLELQGLDLMTIGRMMKLGLHAMDHKWNPADRRWDAFPDHKSRHKTAAWLVKQHGVEPPPASAAQFVAAVQVVFNSNLGDGEEDVAPSAEFEITNAEFTEAEFDE